MSIDSGFGNNNEVIGPDTPGAKFERRLSVYFNYGEGHTYTLEEGDQLIDPLLKPEGAGEDWQPDPLDVEMPKFYIERATKPNTRDRQSIFLKHVAWFRYQEFWYIPKQRVETVAQKPGPRFRGDQQRSGGVGGGGGSTSTPIGRDPVKIPPGN